MKNFAQLKAMISDVAQALGPELCSQMAFVGGATTGLLLTDDYARQRVRITEDVDLIVAAMGKVEYSQLQQQLRSHGFRIAPPQGDEEQPVCAMRLGDLRVDFMPAGDSLGFVNRWYERAIATSTAHELDDKTTIKLVNPVYFIATKLEAWKGRGNGDALASRDLEDILTLVDGREELVEEIRDAEADVQAYIAEEFLILLAPVPWFPEAVRSQVEGDVDRETLLHERLNAIAGTDR